MLSQLPSIGGLHLFFHVSDRPRSENERDFAWSEREILRASRSERNFEQPMFFLFISHFTIKHALIVLYYYLIIPAADLFHFHQVSHQSPENFRSINYGCVRWSSFIRLLFFPLL